MRVLAHDHPVLAQNICYKGVAAPDIHNHAERIRTPLKRIGGRGEDRWIEIPYEQAMDEIAQRLKAIVERYGPESFAVSTSGWNTQSTHSMDRRFMNLLGSPNWISGVSLCAGNTAAVNRLTYGWFPQPDWAKTNCIVLFGHNPRKHSWTPIYNAIKAAQARGAKLIVLDPRVSDQAENADLHLRLRAGTDAAMCLSYPNQHQILKGLMNQELMVAHEIFMTPTAMLADYIMPGDVFSERNHIADAWSWSNRLVLSQKAVEPPAQASSTFQFWRDLAHRFGFEAAFPWASLDEMADDDQFLDDEQGVPHFKGFPGRLSRVEAPANMSEMVLAG